MKSLRIHAGSDHFGWFIFMQITITVWFHFGILLEIPTYCLYYNQKSASNKTVGIKTTRSDIIT